MATAELGLVPGAAVLDAGAGTGKCTALLLERGFAVHALEPQAAMRDALMRSLGSRATVLAGTAEAIPTRAGVFDAAVAATAFHWFDPERAVPELARVLRPDGGLALLWNERDERVPWVQEMTDIIRWDGYRPYGVAHDWSPALEAGGHFQLVSRCEVGFVQWLDRATMVDRVSSISYIATLPEAERAAVLARVAALVADFDEPFALPYRCDVVCARRRSGTSTHGRV